MLSVIKTEKLYYQIGGLDTKYMIVFNQKDVTSENILQCVHDIQAVKSNSELIGVWKQHFHAFGFDHLVYNVFSGFGAHHTNPFKKTYTSNVTDDMQRNYLDNATPFDPLLKYTCTTMNSMWLSDAAKEAYFREGHPAHFLGITFQLCQDGLAVPLIGPNFIKGYFFLAYDVKSEPSQRLFAKGSLINWEIIGLCYFIHVTYCKLQMAMMIKVELTKREMDVLHLIITGKTNREIGEQLGISTNTVNSYLKNLFMKMNTNDRVSTAIKAYSSNLITAPQDIPSSQYITYRNNIFEGETA